MSTSASISTTLLALALAPLAGTIAACSREGAPPVAPVDVAVADVGDAGATSLSAPLAPPAQRDRCTARLEPDTINTGASCTLDERLSKGPGTLHFPCSGTGPTEAVFGEHRFEGMMNDGSMVLSLTTQIDWEDGCHWETKQRIRGELHGTAKLAWTYTEAPVSSGGGAPRDLSACYGSCKATAEIELEGPPGGD